MYQQPDVNATVSALKASETVGYDSLGFVMSDGLMNLKKKKITSLDTSCDSH